MPRSKSHSQRKIYLKNKTARTIAFITDFGLQDQYTAVMKAVVVGIDRSVRMIDITHNVQPHNIKQAGYLLWSAYKYFPNGTIFVCVVDPGVGSERSIICVKTRKYIFLAPDNGLLDIILNEEKIIEQVEIKQERCNTILNKSISATFHGRDIFAPLAGYLSKGILPRKLGVVTKHKTTEASFVNSQTDTIKPCILHIDHFGNIITNIKVKTTGQAVKDIKAISIGTNLVSNWIDHYEDAPSNTPCLIIGSSGLIEISIKNNNAASLLKAAFETPIKVYWQ
jgi:S-adenosyl-L-methionine hydrolase (adenosine-forming)